MSTIPAALAALVALAKRALPAVQVLDGGPTTNVERDVVEIGYSGETGVPDVRSTLTREQLDMQPDLERYDVMCLVSSWRGDAQRDGQPDARTTRERAFDLLNGIRMELARDPQLGRAVMMARLSTLDMTADQTADGPVCTIRFVVHIDAFTAE